MELATRLVFPTPTIKMSLVSIAVAPRRRVSLSSAINNAIDGDLGDSVLDLFVRVAIVAEVFVAMSLVMSS